MAPKKRQKLGRKRPRTNAMKDEASPPKEASRLAAKSGKRQRARSRGNVGLPEPARNAPPQVYAGFHHKSRRLATLDEVRNPAIPTKSVGDLSHPELVKLVVARLRTDTGFMPLHMPGAGGVIDRRRAIREVKALSHIGLHLIEIEKEYIQLQLKRR